MRVRRLTEADAERFWALRLEGLVEAPLAFSASADEERSVPMTYVRERLATQDGCVMGAFADHGGLVGVVGMRVETARKRRHMGHIWGVYVAPEARGTGVSGALMAAAADEARALGARQLHLSVSVRTPAARRLYERVGYRAVGTEPRALLHDGAFIDDVLMVCFLDDGERGLSGSNDANVPKELEGGCHCGAVRFRATARTLRALDCNCSICTKKGFVHLIVAEADFVLVRGAESLTTYRFHTGVAAHMFCKTCGIHPFYRPRSHPDTWDINVRCLDGDAATSFAVMPFDGKRWEQNVATIR